MSVFIRYQSAGPTPLASSASFESDNSLSGSAKFQSTEISYDPLQRTGKTTTEHPTAFKSSLTHLETRVTNLSLQAAYALPSSTDMRNQSGTCCFELRPSRSAGYRRSGGRQLGMMIDCLAWLTC